MAMNPLQMMMLMQGAQGLADSFGAARRGVPQQQSGVGAQGMVPLMAMMQRGQLAQQNYDLEQQKFAAEQAAAERQRAGIAQFAQKNNLPPELAEAAWGELQKALASQYETRTLGEKDEVYGPDGRLIAQNAADAEYRDGGVYDPATRQWTPLSEAQKALLAQKLAGATRISNPVTITQDTLSTKLAETPAKRYEEISSAASGAQSALAATRSIYEMAKLAPDLFGPGMTLTAEAEKGIKAAENILAEGGSLDPQQERLLAIAKAVEVRQTNSAITRLRDIGGNDTEKEYERVKKAIPGLETSLPSQELVFIQEKTAADHLTGLERHVAQRLREAQQTPGQLGLTTTNDAIDEYNRMNPLGDALAKNLQAVMESRGWRTTGTLPGAGGDPFEDIDPNDPDALVGAYKKAGGR